MSTFVITCGGTGGHLTPGIALARKLSARGHKCHLIISQKKVDARIVEKYPDLDFVTVPGVGFSFRPWKLCLCLFNQLKLFLFAWRYLRRIKPDLIIGFGGFVTVGMVLAGSSCGFRIVLHEANRKMGKAILLLSGFASRIYLPEGMTLKGIPPQTVRHFGYPVRDEIVRIPKEDARRYLGIDPHARVVLVLGGSQGADTLTQWVADNFEILGKDGISFYCLTGLRQDLPKTMEMTSSAGKTVYAQFVPFSDNMAAVLSSADLVVSRAGAGSIAELTRCAVPSILVPYPHATNHHQEANARFLEQQGGAIVVDESRLDTLNNEVRDMIFNDWLLSRIHENLEQLDSFNSLKHMVVDLQRLAKREDGLAQRRKIT
jgi:UDP-N-acetylglucosamine--N-acetylmuramyl-(pentapeptide) pyrophosphoryl-undecaprenol N-acetylglucosamine transferase